MKLPYSPIKFRSILKKLYFINNWQPILDSFVCLQAFLAKIFLAKIPQTKISSVDKCLMKTPIVKLSLVFLAFLVLVKLYYR